MEAIHIDKSVPQNMRKQFPWYPFSYPSIWIWNTVLFFKKFSTPNSRGKKSYKEEPELLHENRESAQLARVDEIKQAPELPQVVLQGRPRQYEAVGGVQLLHRPCHLWYKTSGLQKRRIQSSLRLFCRGDPDRMRRWGVFSSFTAFVTYSKRQVCDKEKDPELPQVVLQGRPRQDETVGGVQLLHCICHL